MGLENIEEFLNSYNYHANGPYVSIRKDELHRMIELANSEGRNNRIVTLEYFPPQSPTQIDGQIAIQYWSESATGERTPI